MTKDTSANKFNAFFKSFAAVEDQLDFSMGDQKGKEPVEVLSTGSYAFDDAIGGEGGIPFGRVTQLYGPGGSGKTFFAMLAIKQAQAKDPDSNQMWIDAEGTLDLRWCETLGIDTGRLLVVEGDTAVNGRLCFEMLLGIPREDSKTHALKGKMKEGLLDKVINKEFNINVVVLDSLGAIQPPGEDIAAIGKMNMALMARFLSTTLKKLSLEVKKSNVAFIIINHKKDSMDAYGPDHTYSGGNSYTHTLSLNAYIEAIQRKDAMILDEKENKVGQTVRIAIEKSKAGSQKKTEVKIHFGKGIIDLHEELADLALDYDVVTKPTAMTYAYGDRKWVGMPKFVEAIKEDESFALELSSKVKEARINKWKPKTKEQTEVASNEESIDISDTEVPKNRKSIRSLKSTESLEEAQ